MKTYETPELELIRFQTEDIVTSSPWVEDVDDPNAGGTDVEP